MLKTACSIEPRMHVPLVLHRRVEFSIFAVFKSIRFATTPITSGRSVCTWGSLLSVPVGRYIDRIDFNRFWRNNDMDVNKDCS